jgi:uncharacterized protein YceK
MKKVAPIAIVALIGALSLTSCKKVYTCACTYNGVTTEVSSGVKISHKDAKTWCTTYNTGAGYSCSLK